MKKFTLTLAACAIAFSGMAQMQCMVSKSLPPMFEAKTAKFNVGTAFKATAMPNSVVAKSVRKDLSQILSPVAASLKAPSAGTSAERISFYHDPYIFSDVLGGVALLPMSTGSFSVSGSTVNINLYGEWADYIDDIEGTIYDGTNSMSANGLDSITFKNNQPVAYYNSTGEPVVIGLFDLQDTDGDGYYDTATPSSKEAFGAYYDRSDNSLYFMDEEFLSLYSPSTNEHLDYIKGRFYTVESQEYDSKMYNATVTASSIFNDEGYLSPGTQQLESSPAVALISSDGILVKGAIPSAPCDESWAFFNVDYEAGEASFGYMSLLTEFTYSNAKYSLVTFVIDSETRYGKEAASCVFEQDLDDNYCISSSDWIGAYVFLGTGESGVWDAFEQYTLTINTANTENGINGVSTETAKVASKEYFDLSGRKVENTSKGLVIEKITYADGKTLSRKVVK